MLYRNNHSDRRVDDNSYRITIELPTEKPFRIYMCIKKNQTTPRPSEHPPVMGEKMSKRLGGIKRLQINTKPLHGI